MGMEGRLLGQQSSERHERREWEARESGFKRATRGRCRDRFLRYTWIWVPNKHESSLGALSQQQGHGVQFLGSIAVPNRTFAEGSNATNTEQVGQRTAIA